MLPRWGRTFTRVAGVDGFWMGDDRHVVGVWEGFGARNVVGGCCRRTPWSLVLLPEGALPRGKEFGLSADHREEIFTRSTTQREEGCTEAFWGLERRRRRYKYRQGADGTDHRGALYHQEWCLGGGWGPTSRRGGRVSDRLLSKSRRTKVSTREHAVGRRGTTVRAKTMR